MRKRDFIALFLDAMPFRIFCESIFFKDSLGGNAKTLMFVNISPADYNSAESVISLT